MSDTCAQSDPRTDTGRGIDNAERWIWRSLRVEQQHLPAPRTSESTPGSKTNSIESKISIKLERTFGSTADLQAASDNSRTILAARDSVGGRVHHRFQYYELKSIDGNLQES